MIICLKLSFVGGIIYHPDLEIIYRCNVSCSVQVVLIVPLLHHKHERARVRTPVHEVRFCKVHKSRIGDRLDGWSSWSR